jgi:hypothetical protein
MAETTTQIIKSFKLQDNLNPKIWDKKSNQYHLKGDIRDSILEIVDEFIGSIDFDVFYEDIVLTGSICNFNWSKYSDLDIHLIVDYKQFSEETKELFKEFFNLKKLLFKEYHDIKIKGYDSEIYVQDAEEEHTSTGVYSVLYDNWIVEPKKVKPEINGKSIKKKAEQWMEIIDDIIENVGSEDLESAKRIIKKYKDKLKNYRKAGLDEIGEFSEENLVFKILRRNGYIEKLFNFEKRLTDKKLSVSEKKEY